MYPSMCEAPESRDLDHLAGRIQELRSLDWATQCDLGVDIFTAVSEGDHYVLVQEVLSNIPQDGEGDLHETGIKHLVRFFRRVGAVCSRPTIIRGFILWASSTPIQFSPFVCSSVARLFLAAMLVRNEAKGFFTYVPESVEANILRAWDALDQ